MRLTSTSNQYQCLLELAYVTLLHLPALVPASGVEEL